MSLPSGWNGLCLNPSESAASNGVGCWSQGTQGNIRPRAALGSHFAIAFNWGGAFHTSCAATVDKTVISIPKSVLQCHGRIAYAESVMIRISVQIKISDLLVVSFGSGGRCWRVQTIAGIKEYSPLNMGKCWPRSPGSLSFWLFVSY